MIHDEKEQKKKKNTELKERVKQLKSTKNLLELTSTHENKKKRLQRCETKLVLPSLKS